MFTQRTAIVRQTLSKLTSDEDTGIRWTIALVVVCLLSLLIVTIRVAALDRMTNQTLADLAAVASMLDVLQDAETGQRGYLLTGDEDFLSAYNDALPLFTARVADLRTAGERNARLRVSSAEMERLAREKLDLLGQDIESFRSGRRAEALQAVASGRGKSLMDHFRAAATDFQRQELTDLEELRAATTRIRIWGLGTAAASLLVFAVLGWQILAATQARLAERSAASAALALAEERLRLAQAGAKVGVWDWDLRSGLVTWTPELEEIFGLEPGSVRSYDDFRTRVHPDDVARVEAERDAAVRDQQQFDIEFRIVRPDGEVRWVSTIGRGYPDKGRGAKTIRILGNNVDITEKKLVRERLRTSEARLRSIIDTALDAIITIDDRGIVESANPATESIFGFAASELVGNNVSMLMLEPHRSRHDNFLARYLETGASTIAGISREMEGQRKDGSVFPLELRVSDWSVEGKRYFTFIMRDITFRRQNEEHARLLMHELSHRTKNVLAIVQAIATQTATGADDPQQFVVTFGKRIEALGASLDLLLGTDWKGVSLSRLVQAQLVPFLDDAKHRLRAAGPEVLLSPTAVQDLGLVLHELATNASKYGALSQPQGRVEVEWSCRKRPNGQDTFLMSWREVGGPVVTRPEKTGFGRTIIQQLPQLSLSADVELSFAPEGLVWRLEAPAELILAPDRPLVS